MPGKGERSSPGCFMTINDHFDDDILLQILCRLPLQSAMVCKLVCNRWLSLISTHSFTSCFISTHHHHHQQLKKYLILKEHRCCLFLTSQVPSSDISFNFLPTTESSKVVNILASSDDLFLCARRHEELFLCNPFTKKWFQLPPPPPSSDLHFFGFTCKPYYEVEGDGERILINSSCSFRVVRLKVVTQKYEIRVGTSFELDIFSSQTWQWTTTTMQSSHYIRPSWATSHNGLLYWKCRPYGQVVVHDPYNNEVRYVIYTPDQPRYELPDFRFSVSEGSLLVFNSMVYRTFRVWELEEWDQREWRLKIEVELQEYLVNSSEMFKWAGAYKMLAVASHPNDNNIFFLWSHVAGLGTINLRTRVWKPRFLPTSSQLFIRASSCPYGQYQRFENVPHQMVVIKAPCWPTPISALFNQSPTKPTN